MTPHKWNTDLIDDNRFRVYGGWHNWLDQSIWRALDGGFVEDSGRYVASQIPGLYSVPALATGSVEFEVNQRWDIFRRSLITEAPWSLEITPENVSPVAAQRDDNRPDQILYPNAFGTGIDLRYTIWLGRGPRVTREVVIRSEPPGDHDLRVSWLIRSSNARVWIPRGGQLVRPWSGNVSQAILGHSDQIVIRAGTSDDNESQLRGSGVKAPIAWYYNLDGELVTQPIKLNITIVAADTVRVEKIIPRSFVREAFAAGATAVMCDETNTFSPDPHAETTSVDGYCVENTAQSWSSLRADVGSSHNDTSSPLIIALLSSALTNQFYNMHRSICLFDTSSLTGQTVTEATLGATYYTHSNTYPETAGVALVGSTPASNTDLVNSDYMELGDTRYCDSDVEDTSWSGVMTWSMNATGIAAIDIDGITKLGLVLGFDFDNSPPTWTASGKQANLQVRSAENTGTASDPYLEVITVVSAAGSPAALLGLIV
jgi:hypothetical protein